MCTNDESTLTMIYGNRYRQIKKLGQGSFGTAYLVHDTKCKPDKYETIVSSLHAKSIQNENRSMFSKVLKSIFIGDISPDESSNAEHEAAMLARLRHAHIVRFYDSFIDGQYFCIITEYCQVILSSNIDNDMCFVCRMS
jgi:NIMA (never in mitosis gene a)-related kinase 11